ncbi:MAG TPA: fibrobacter succinogenes major paralogous domain-containing protein [Ignavibacteria bacterium]
MKQTYKFLFAILMAAMIFSFGANKSISQVTDIDGNTYKTITIGKQVWFSENLNVEHYRNGDVIPQVQDKEEWASLTSGAWCYYDNNSGNGTTYGKLYNWYAVNDSRGLAPEGWHVSTDEEFTKLYDFLGGADIAGNKMKSTNGWDENGNGTNSSDFSGLPGGYRNHDGYFGNLGRNGCFWTSTDFNSINAWFRNLVFSLSDVIRHNYLYVNGLYVRCVKD